jgi:hypothetical protein
MVAGGKLHLDTLKWSFVLPIRPWIAMALPAVLACSTEGGRSAQVHSQRERDSVLGASRLPGAQGVRGALGASDSAAARNARLDSITPQR